MAYPALIIGIRNRGMAWAQAIGAHPDFELGGVADVDPAVLDARVGELGLSGESRYPDYREALASGRYRVAVVVVPNHMHYPVARDVLEAGVHCLLEKPFTERLDQAEELVVQAGNKDLALVIGHNYRFKLPFMRTAEVIRAGRLGPLIGIEVSFHRYRPPRHEHERDMRYPMLFLQGIHHLDLLAGFLPSPIDEIHCRHFLPAGSPWRSPSVCHLILRSQDGTLVNYRGSYESRGEQTPYDGLWRFEFARGDLILDEEGKLWQVEQGDRTCLYEPQAGERSSDERLLDTLRETIEEGREAPTSGRRNISTLRLLFEVIKRGEDIRRIDE